MRRRIYSRWKPRKDVNGKGFIANSYPAEKVIAAIQTFGDRINFNPLLHFLVTEGGVDEAAVSPVLMNRKRFMSAGVFHKISCLGDSRLAEIFAREVLAMLVRR